MVADERMKVTKIIGNLFILTFCLANKVCSMPAESNKVNSILLQIINITYTKVGHGWRKNPDWHIL